jgi:hypothetical protein
MRTRTFGKTGVEIPPLPTGRESLTQEWRQH